MTTLIFLVSFCTLGFISIWGTLRLSAIYKEKFNRNFVLVLPALGNGLGGLLIPISTNFFGSTQFIEVITFNPYYDFETGLFYFGFILIIFSSAINIAKSNYLWGIVQSVFQTILAAFFWIFVLALFYRLIKIGKKNSQKT